MPMPASERERDIYKKKKMNRCAKKKINLQNAWEK